MKAPKQRKTQSPSKAAADPQHQGGQKQEGKSLAPPGVGVSASESPIQGFFDIGEVWETVTEGAKKVVDWVKEATKTLSESEVEAAKKWATESKIGREAIIQLQEELGIEQTGAYDETTIQAVYFRQRQINQGRERKIKEDGIADRAFFGRLGLVFTEEILPGEITSEFFKQFFDENGEPRMAFKGGVTVGVYTHYKNQTTKNKTFWQRAHPWANRESAIYLNQHGQLSLGKSNAIFDTGDIIEKVQAISRGLYNLYAIGVYYGWCKAQPGTSASNPPTFTKVKDLGIFAHGMQYGMSTHENGSYTDGILSNTLDSYKNTESNLSSFVKGLKGGISKDVRMHLFACNTAREFDSENPFSYAYNKDGERYKNKKGKWAKDFDGTNMMPDEGEHMGGENSFAALLAGELGEDASVYGHMVPGHTTRNLVSTVFGKDADGEGQMHLFNKMYTPDFVDEQLLALTTSEAEQTKLRKPLRKMMWKHFTKSVGNKGSAAIGVQIGEEMFMRPANARKILQKDFIDNYLTQAEIRKLKQKL